MKLGEDMKELKIYWCKKCDKVHRKSSKDGKAHLAEHIKETQQDQSFLLTSNEMVKEKC